jgi:undecaprenyl diphosphate synthase
MAPQMTTLPQHIAFVPDGNRRWAKLKGLPSMSGHQAGLKIGEKIIEKCFSMGIKYVTMFAFSTENWNRSLEEVQALMRIYDLFARRLRSKLVKHGIQIQVIGDLTKLPKFLQRSLLQAVEETKHNHKMVVNIAINYGAREEIVRATQRIIEKGTKPEDINQESIAKELDTRDQPDPDFIIRTSGEQRLSNFLLWQAAYSELYFSPLFWPDFNEAELEKAVDEFQNRQRRFGK